MDVTQQSWTLVPDCLLCEARSMLLPLQDPNGKPGCDFMGVNHYAR